MKNRMTVSIVTSLFSAILGVVGFANNTRTDISEPTEIRSSILSPAVESNIAAQAAVMQERQQDDKTTKKKGYLERAAEALRKAKQSGNSQADSAQKWLAERINNASESTSGAAQDTSDWATETYEMLKGKGLTTAGSVGEWLSQDIRNMESWEYKVVKLKITSPDLESKLSTLGANGWELVSNSPVFESNPTHVMIFKKSRRSYLKSVPLKDLLPLIPLMGGEGNK